MKLAKSEILNQIKAIISEDYVWEKLQHPFTSMPQAAVLIPLIWNSKTYDIDVLLTKRSQNLSNDKGHICFPGGMREKSDKDEIDTALRESEEEIGLSREDVEIFGTCVPFVSKRKILMATVVGLVNEGFEPKQSDEVEFSFRLPLQRFLTSIGHSHSTYNYDLTNKLLHIHFFEDTVLDNQLVQTWGVTAQILIEVAVAILGKATEFDDFENETYSNHTPFHKQRSLLAEIVQTNLSNNGKL